MNVEIKKALDLKKLPKSSSSELMYKFQSLMDELYALKTDDHYDQKYEEPNYDRPVPLPYSHYHSDDYYHKNYPPPPCHKHREPPKNEIYPTATTTMRTPYIPYETSTKPSYKAEDYHIKEDPYYREDKSYSYVKSNYEKPDYEHRYIEPMPATTKKPYYPPPTTTKRPYEVYKPDDYQPTHKYSFEVLYDDYDPYYMFYPTNHYDKPKEQYPVPNERPYRPAEPPKMYVPPPTTSKPYTSYSKVKSEVYANDRPKSSYPEPYYDFVKYLEKDYPQRYFPDIADYYHNSAPTKKIQLYPCKEEYGEVGPYELPLLYNPNRYDSLKRKDSPVHDTAALLKNFARKDLYSSDTEPYADKDRDDYNSPYRCKDSDEVCKRIYNDAYPAYITKRKTANKGDTRTDEVEVREEGVRKVNIPDWEQSKAIAGNGELYGEVTKDDEPNSLDSTFEIQAPEDEQDTEVFEDDQANSEKKNEYKKIVEQIWTEIEKIQTELHRRKQLEGVNQNEMMNDGNDFAPDMLITTDDDIKARHVRDCKS